MTKFIAVVSGKGGVGKTTTTLNLGQAFTNLGRKTIVLDGNLVTPNLGINLGFLNPKSTLNQFLRQEKGLHEITYLHESGLSLIPASPSFAEFQKTNTQGMVEVFEHLENTAEVVLVDSPSGLGFDVEQILKNCDEAVLVVNPNLSSTMDALKTMKLAKDNNCTVTGIVLNMTYWGRNQLSSAQVEQILNHHVIAQIRNDRKIRKAAHHGLPLAHLYPRCKSAIEFHKAAQYFLMETR